MRPKLIIPGFLAAIVSGCAGSATHEIVSAHQAADESLTCGQITAEITKAQVVIDGVNKDKDDLTGADVVDGLLWFPFNLIAKEGNYTDAIEAADGRIERLSDLRKEKNCSTVVENKSNISDVVAKISELNRLYKSGAIDEGEYKALKQKLLAGITGAGGQATTEFATASTKITATPWVDVGCCQG